MMHDITTITLTVPRPPAVLSPNGRACWQAKARAAKAMREASSTNGGA